MLGIDEAGRGPVIGPLVMAGVCIGEGKQAQLELMGVKDSKFLAKAKRETLYKKIIELADSYYIEVVSPAQIDEAMLNPKLNLNWLEAHTCAKIINGAGDIDVIVDCPSINIKSYRSYLTKLLKNKHNLLCEHKAERYSTVAAASIIAKVTRDNILEEIKRQIGQDFGSGYMGDEKTRGFLKKFYKVHRKVFRTQWQPYKDAAAQNEQRTLNFL